MHHRRGNQIPETSDGVIHHLPASPARPRWTMAHPSVDGSAGKQLGRVGFAALLVVLSSALMAFEFAVYQMLGETTTSPSIPTVDPTTPVKSGAGAARMRNAAVLGGDDENDPPPKRNDAPGENVPPPKRNDAPPSPAKPPATFQPTARQQGWRVKDARRQALSGAQFWKTHDPDPVPPLPPDRDPKTGEELPPVIAYVTTLTKCGPKHRGGLDGAAVLLHSIRRNSHGWVPMGGQIEPSDDEQGGGGEGAARPQYGGDGGRYRHRAYVIVDPSASPENEGRSGECARFLRKIGYTVLHRPPLVSLFELPEDDKSDGAKKSSYYDELRSQGYVGMRRPPSTLRAGEHPDRLRRFMHNDGCCGYTELLKLHVYGMVEHPLAVHLDFDSLLLRPMDDLFDAMLGRGGDDDDDDD
eukprot:CAMPEP_0172546118 /NCGR_PEP_ID=MMETSP1067-20121228/15931_1 /TAXON_ID=265564 ORGANISM="Thalassiosira punctigera, Strain Tpunct2005C2" /NCGR_SAMPLE_ID=MMETSP1067 /ASSEMBLY_ACC=CAM_ASM_000444 /LENGTH=411 /DNA_ID=CAMNT_0013332997 /DNA_START=266 /DNA_END=1498 /DNA_ORIENTATION=-